ncbi:hypothetical protein M8818_004738 [Zalaria obscura]|uniref:Uncharacterized protein n=1 Tax=Zalaria obscura TaxID=2024903 RepID=A0ACC3SCF2_9PEZI
MAATIEDLAQEWLRLDQDPTTRQEIETLLSQPSSKDELELRLRKRIAFGTAGLRGAMTAGFSRMNSLTVIQASQGLAAYVLSQEPRAREMGIVIGRDARYNSEKFAKMAAAAFLAKGIKVLWLDLVHTPLVPFAVDRMGAAAGVMVTASHNPANDNGYKVYWSNGCQIIPPHDAGIARAIEQNLEPVTWDTSVVTDANPLVIDALELVVKDYYAAVTEKAVIPKNPQASPIPFVYTPMHGVGLPFFKTAVEAVLNGDLTALHVVEAQAHPDPAFPTVRFPNPEEHGALDLAMETADKQGIQLVFANDPDADRFSAAEKVDGKWRQFTGNQLGMLFASVFHELYEGPKACLASTVSTRMLARMAEKEGMHFEETLTGFKWMGNVGRKLQKQGYTSIFAFEEAIGYMFSNVVFDKDGIAAAAMFLAACHVWRTKGLTPWGKLQQLYEKYGYFEDANTYLRSPSAETTNQVFESIRARKPTHVGSRRILQWRDLLTGYDSSTPDHKPLLPVDKTAQMITCVLERDVVFTVRGSGTEPKIKLYIEGSVVPESGEQKQQAAVYPVMAKEAAKQVCEDLVREWFRPEETGLRLAGS